MELKVFCWFDKIDKVFMKDSILADRSTRAVCRGYIAAFEKDRKMNYKEFELHLIGVFDDETGLLTPCDEVIDPTIVFEKPDISETGKETDI